MLMKSLIADFVRNHGYRPALRAEIRFYRSENDGKGIVTVHDPQSDRSFQLYEAECLIAREMNGQRDLDELTSVARRHVPWADRGHVERLAIQIAGMGLLSNVPLARASGYIAQPARPILIPADSNVSSNGLDDWTDISSEPIDTGDGASVHAPAVVFQRAKSEAATPVVPQPIPEPPPPPVAVEQPSAAPPIEQRPQKEWDVERPSFFARHRRLCILGILVGIVALLAVIPYPLYITEPCNVRPATRSEVRAQVEGVVVQVLVNEGDEVKVGTPLVRLDDRDVVYALEQATSNVDKLTAALAKVRTGNRPEEIRRARTLVTTRANDAHFAQIEATRYKKLYKQGVASAAQRDEALKVLSLKQSETAQAQAELKLVQAGSRSEEVLIAEAELKRAEAEVTYLKKKQELLVIKSPIDGRVLTPRFHERLHAKLAAGDTVCEVGSTKEMLVEVMVDESEADVLRVGQPIEVKVRSYPLDAFRGRIDFIAPAIVDDSGRRVLRVDARVDNASGQLQPRMTGYAEIDAGTQTVLGRVMRRAVRWVRVRFLI
jgi:multidrug resistance efflux pump